MINRVARNQTIKKIPHLLEQILHLPLPDVAGEVADVDRAAPAPAHPSPLTYQQSKKGRINQQNIPRRVRVRIRIYATRYDTPQENKSRRQRARTTRGTMRKGDSYLNSCGRRVIEVEARVPL